ncbi:MAG: hypothetical protein EOM23_01630, partial [Candidatus Moranbacteria bacterium]|nr:hypothetical protein [Candidatus Moranbacteria bacterium]
MPSLANFIPEQYQNKGKVWDINSAPNGIVYMALDQGLLEFDGKNWNSFKGSRGFTRSLLVVNDSLIYTGSDLDFGHWKKNEYQRFEYTSLYPFLNSTGEINEEFWQVHEYLGNIVFVSSSNIYIYNNEQFTKIAAPGKLEGSFKVGNQLYFADEEFGLLVFSDLSLKQVLNYSRRNEFQIAGLFQNENQLIIVTKDNGLFYLDSGVPKPIFSELSDYLKSTNVFSFEILDNNHLAFGTVLRGVFVSDFEGNIIHQINRHKGLPNNTILSLHFTQSKILWVGMDYGVSSIDFLKNQTFFYDYRGDFGTAHTAFINGDDFLLGTNQGLYTAKWQALDNKSEFFDFTLVNGSQGQVWTIEKFDNEILIGHDKGLMTITENVAKFDIEMDGIWTFAPYNEYLLAGNYNGISILEKKDGEWALKGKMDLIFGSCNQILVEKNNILWINIPNFGIIRALVNSEVQPIDRQIFIESEFEGTNPMLRKHNSSILVITDKTIYSFCLENNKFIEELDSLYRLEKLRPSLSFLNHRALGNSYDFVPVANGFSIIRLDSLFTESMIPVNLTLRKIQAFNTREMLEKAPNQKIPYSVNNLRFEFLVPNTSDVLYSFSLNKPENWSGWTESGTAEFYGLKEGKYTLYVKAIVNNDKTETKSISFTIAPPWFRSWIAYAAYFIGFILFVLALNKYQSIILKKQKKQHLIRERRSLLKQAEKHRKRLLQLEQEKLLIQYDRVKNQLKDKTIELAKKAKENEDKNRLLLSLKEKCLDAREEPSKSKQKLN